MQSFWSPLLTEKNSLDPNSDCVLFGCSAASRNPLIGPALPELSSKHSKPLNVGSGHHLTHRASAVGSLKFSFFSSFAAALSGFHTFSGAVQELYLYGNPLFFFESLVLRNTRKTSFNSSCRTSAAATLGSGEAAEDEPDARDHIVSSVKC